MSTKKGRRGGRKSGAHLKILKDSPDDIYKKHCGLCGSTKKLMKTECCDNWICDDYDNYQLFSYAKNSCARNHDRYTICAVHFHEQHKTKEWQNCKKCRIYCGTEMFVYFATNEFNFTILENPPTFIPTKCGKCNRIIILAEESYSISGEKYYCTECQGDIP